MSSAWEQAVSEYLALLKLSPNDAKALVDAKTATDVVTFAVQALTPSARAMVKSEAFAEKMFLAAVASAGTHDEFISRMECIKQDKTPAVVSYEIATLLRYTDSVDKFLDSMGNTTFAAAFVFGAIRYLVDVAVKNINLLIQIKGKFEDINLRLRRLDVYLTLKEPTEAVKSMCVRALVNILRFCGLATKYLRTKLKNEIEAVIVDLEQDTAIEVASGVAQLNSMMGQVQSDLQSLSSVFSGDQSTISANGKLVSTPQRSHFMVPYQRNPHFIGRDELLNQLRTILCDSKPKQYNHRIALYGLGGIGKTQLAIEYAHRNRDSYRAIYWISGVEEASLLSGFQDIAKITGCVDTSLNPADVATGVLSWLREQDNWLLVIDNLDYVAVVAGYLPDMVSGGHTIITTRNPDATSIPAEGLEVEVLHRDTATELLLTRSKVDRAANSPAAKTEAAQIVDLLGYLPLAIEQAAAYIREASKDIFAFLASYHENRRVLHLRMPHGNWGYTSSVATTWLLSFDEVAKRNANAVQLLQLFAFLNPDDILTDFLRTGKEALDHDLQVLVQNDVGLNDALFMLERFSLIRRLKSGKGISIHRLVQAVIQDEMSPGLLTKNWEIFIGMCNETFPWELTHETILKCRHYQDQVLIPLTAAPLMKSLPLRQALRCVAKFLAADGKYKKAEELAQTAVDISTKISGKEHPDTLADLNLLACTYWYQGRFPDAVTIHEEVLEIRRRILGDNHPDTLKTMNNLSLTYRYQGRFDSAVQLQQQALTASVQLLGEEHPDTLVGMNALGATYRNLRRFEDARRLQERAVELRKKILGEQHIDTLRSMRSLAATLQDEGLWEESVRLDEYVLDVRRKILGDEHPETLVSIHELGITYWYQGRHSGVRLVEKALAGRKRILGDNHLDTLTSLKDLESIHAGRSKRSGACSFKTS